MDSSKLKAIIVGVLATFAALYLGITAATAQFETIAWVIGSFTVVVCIYLGRKIWLLIPFFGAVDLSIRMPSMPTTLLIAQVLVLGFCLLLFLMRKLPIRLGWTELEWWALLLTLFIVQVYMRNPVSVHVIGGDSVGGKPYVLYVIALLSAALLAVLQVPPAELKTALRLSIIGGLVNLAVSTTGRYVPTLGYWTGATYVDTSVADYSGAGTKFDPGAATRHQGLMAFGRNLSLWISAFKSPIKACLHPLWGTMVLLAVVAAALSGFRNAVAMVAFTFFVAICYRGGFIAIIISSLAGIFGIAILAFVNILTPLPANIQRSLSFLPGTWEQRYVRDAEGSNEWRFEIWREVLLTDRWIKNKWLGDGLGFSARELAYQASSAGGKQRGRGISGFDFRRESILANGDYHSGPVQTIRIIGYAGLAVVLLFQIRLALQAHRQIIRCRGTEWFPLALFIGIPLIWNPVFFVLIFGEFKTCAATLLLGSAMVRMLQNNLPLPAWSKPSRAVLLSEPSMQQHKPILFSRG